MLLREMSDNVAAKEKSEKHKKKRANSFYALYSIMFFLIDFLQF